ncbi:MAG: hypothetical protein JRJ77_15670 [Deltaproteobacteria bacterium]|nr:hypothetical protein [Deltaproteobacteria bacterium]MBW2106586.1 hypothetical protein [Deltaproteobacteria bacterium]
MEITIANPQKGRLESKDIEFTDENTTWFEDCEKDDEVYMITDFEGCLLISQLGYYYPVLIYDESRIGLSYDKNKARELIGLQV